VSVTIRSEDLRPGPHSGFVTVETDHPIYPSVQIPVKVEAGTMADAFISTLLIDSIAPGAHKSFSLCRSSMPKAGLPKVADVEYKGDPAIHIIPSSEGSGEGSQLWVLSVSRDAKIGEVKKGVLRVKVSGRPSNKIEVRILVFVK
jgi:hypothetical protein